MNDDRQIYVHESQLRGLGMVDPRSDEAQRRAREFSQRMRLMLGDWHETCVDCGWPTEDGDRRCLYCDELHRLQGRKR